MKTRMLALAFALPVLSVLAATPEDVAAARAAKEQLAWFTPAAARRATSPRHSEARFRRSPGPERIVKRRLFTTSFSRSARIEFVQLT